MARTPPVQRGMKRYQKISPDFILERDTAPIKKPSAAQLRKQDIQDFVRSRKNIVAQGNTDNNNEMES